MAVRLLKIFALLLLALPAAAALYSSNLATSVWTITVPLIPLTLIVIGFGRWRKVCPLSWSAKLFQNSTLIKKRFVSPWLTRNFYALQFGLLLLAFSARHWLLNYETASLLFFFGAIFLMALLTGLYFSGKTWCNYLCPVSFVEKLYTVSNAHRYGINSACSACTACKVNCPDIDMENSYWKESTLGQKKHLFYAFPGLVFGFYAYFYLHGGSWAYYFSGDWAHYQGRVVDHLFGSGFFFLPGIPLFAAAPLTMLLAAALSLLFFLLLERIMIPFRSGYAKEPQNIQHFIVVLAAYTAFNTFYAFAGAPSYSQLPIFYDLFRFAVVVLSTLILLRELPREERFYLQERFARKILQKWQGETPKTSNLKEIYYTYANQQKDHKVHLENYKETVLELLEDGVLTIEESNLLDKLRLQMGITDSEHKKIIGQIRQEHQDLFNITEPISQEKLFQKRSYQNVLKEMLDKLHEIDIKQFEQLRIQFNITPQEHETILQNLVHSNETIKKQISSKLHQLKILATAYHAIPKISSSEYRFMIFSFHKTFLQLLEELKKPLCLLYNAETVESLLHIFTDTEASGTAFFETQIEAFDPELHGQVAALFNLCSTRASHSTKEEIEEALLHFICAGYDDLIAATLLFAYKGGYETASLYIESWTTYSNPTVKEIAIAIKEGRKGLTDVEKLSFLHSVPIFSKLSHEDLFELVLEAKEEHFVQGQSIVVQGEAGDALFIITDGICDVFIEKDAKIDQVADIRAGDLIGEIAVISKVNRVATVIGQTEVTALKLSGQAFTKILYHNPSMSIDIMRQVTKRLLRQ